MDSPTVRRAFRLSIWDGLFANLYANLTGGVFIVGYMLALKTSEVQVGLLAAFPGCAGSGLPRLRTPRVVRCQKTVKGGFVSQFLTLFRRRPKPRCPTCHKWNRVYLTGGSFLSHCVHCGASLELRRPAALWGVLVILGVGMLALAAAIPLLSR